MIFVLDEGNEGAFEPLLDIGPRWKELPHARSRSRGFVLLAGERLVTGWFRVDAAHRVRLEAMRVTEAPSPDGLELALDVEIGTGALPIAQVHLGEEQHWSETVSIDVSLEAYAGQMARVTLRCTPGRESDPTGDWAAVLTFVLAPADELNAAAARAQTAWRLANEIEFFTTLHADAAGGPAPAGAHVSPVPEGAGPRAPDALEFVAKLEGVAPASGDDAFAYTHRLLQTLVGRTLIDFAGRLRALGGLGRRPRMLSLCAGQGHIEADLLEQSGVEVDITLLDVNPALLERAAARMPPGARVRLWHGAVDALRARADEFDVVCFVSGLHHVVRLEDVLSRAASCLATDGELWLIGEQVGRNGSRLWPEARRVADRLFRQLPERLRRNRVTGRVDEGLPDVNCAAGCFEGIRSEDIPVALARHFTPIVEHRRDCFLWRLVDAAYAGNYDLTSAENLRILRRLVAEEFAFYANGGLGTELNGAYRSKIVR